MVQKPQQKSKRIGVIDIDGTMNNELLVSLSKRLCSDMYIVGMIHSNYNAYTRQDEDATRIRIECDRFAEVADNCIIPIIIHKRLGDVITSLDFSYCWELEVLEHTGPAPKAVSIPNVPIQGITPDMVVFDECGPVDESCWNTKLKPTVTFDETTTIDINGNQVTLPSGTYHISVDGVTEVYPQVSIKEKKCTDHKWKGYQGIYENFTFCETCDVKKGEE